MAVDAVEGGSIPGQQYIACGNRSFHKLFIRSSSGNHLLSLVHSQALVTGVRCCHNLDRRMESFSAEDALSEPVDALAPDAGDVSGSSVAMLTPVEAARRLGVTRSRIYALV